MIGNGSRANQLCLAVLVSLSLTPAGTFAAEPSTGIAAIANRVKQVTRVTHVVGRGDSLAAILGRYGVGAAEVQRWWNAARPKRDLSKLMVGQKLELSFAENRLMRLGYQIGEYERLIVEQDPARGDLHTRVIEPDVIVAPVGARGRVERSFYGAAKRAGIPESVISEMVDILSVKIDFNTKVRPGDRFRVLYEGRHDDRGRVLKAGRVLAAEYYGAHQSVAAFLYEDEEGRIAYVDKNGRSLDDSLLRYPLEFTRISSTFSYSRFHPILKRRKPHLGVDFAAPTGTPIRAIGTGVIRWSAWKGAFGRHVEIDHGGDLVSAYSHLSRIHPAARVGHKVERGQIIGYVGSSGRATGPHLHFAIFENGRYVNPMTPRRSPAVAHVDHRRFVQQQANLSEQLRVMTTSHKPRRSTSPLTLSSLTQAEHLKPGALTF
jgi:murein DD-endopeptidase MepM/ murein hydrolase activator NlpD